MTPTPRKYFANHTYANTSSWERDPPRQSIHPMPIVTAPVSRPTLSRDIFCSSMVLSERSLRGVIDVFYISYSQKLFFK